MSDILSAEDVEFLTQLADELETQERYATARPVLFQVLEPTRIFGFAPDCADGDGLLMGDEYAECVTLEEAKEWLAEGDIAQGDLAPLDSLEAVNSYCEGMGIRCMLTGYRDSETLQNAFLTRSGYEEHMARNRHNYAKGSTFYVSYAHRNPQLERLMEIVGKFASAAADGGNP